MTLEQQAKATAEQWRNGLSDFEKSVLTAIEAYKAGYLADRWISVADRLPEVGQRVKVFVNTGNHKTSFQLITDYKKSGFDENYAEYVSHWSCLDAPPKAGFSKPSHFKCRGCGSRSQNKGVLWIGSNKTDGGKYCSKCETAIRNQNEEDNDWYNSQRM